MVVRGVIEMARSLGLTVIAEGVETDEQLDLLAKEGCQYYQGFLCAEPLTVAALGGANRRVSDKRDVSGVWYGRWTSPNRLIPQNNFIATLEERASLVSGSITERHRDVPGIIRAHVDGVRAGARIEFTKQYDGSGRLAHAVHYGGAINGAGTEIRGTFRFGRYSGDFVMTREKFDAEELENEEVVQTRIPAKID